MQIFRRGESTTKKSLSYGVGSGYEYGTHGGNGEGGKPKKSLNYGTHGGNGEGGKPKKSLNYGTHGEKSEGGEPGKSGGESTTKKTFSYGVVDGYEYQGGGHNDYP